MSLEDATLSTPSTPDRAGRILAANELAHLAAGLDPETVTIAALAYCDGWTQDEIAAHLDYSRRTVGKKLKRFLEHTRMQAGLPAGVGGVSTAADGGGR